MQNLEDIGSFCKFRRRSPGIAAVAVLAVGLSVLSSAQVKAQGNSPPYPPLEKVTEGYEKVVSTLDGEPGLYTVWAQRKEGQLLAALPKDFLQQKYFIALTVAGGTPFAGLHSGDMYVYWKQYDRRLALITPNLEVRSTGDAESKASVRRLFTDKVLLDLPILTMVPNGGPVIDLDALLLQNAPKFFGGRVQIGNANLVTLKTVKAFPKNIEIGVELPMADGILRTLHYSISLITENTNYQPRIADERIGYFTTAFNDYGKYQETETRVRYINRWHLEKADPSLKISPPKNPIIFYIEHTTPIRYRRWVREGTLYWNKAFEKIGISNAIEVHYQDAASGAHMEKDPEDVRYNFLRWLNNNISTAIGPSRAHPLTGQILDADVVLTDGWIREFWSEFTQKLPEIAMEGANPETLAWLEKHPRWDPRLRLAPPAQRDFLEDQRRLRGSLPFGGHPWSQTESDPANKHAHAENPLLKEKIGTDNLNPMFAFCQCANGKAMDLSLLRMHLLIAEAVADDPKPANPNNPTPTPNPNPGAAPKPDVSRLDGMPEEFIGPLLADLVAHEVGHTLGLRHNFKASSAYSLRDLNSKTFKGIKPFTASVMDYNPVNINLGAGDVQGDYTMINVGPYDYWAIEYGYTFENNLKPILDRVADPELPFATDEDTIGPDPLARRYDFGKDPLDYAETQMRLAKYHRERLIDKFVKSGDSWSKARKGYEMTLYLQTRALNMMANWVGGVFIHRDKKGDPQARNPLVVVPAETQRKALQFVIKNAFLDEVYGLTPDMLTKLAQDHWNDAPDHHEALAADPAWPVHDRILGIQASVLSQLMNPNTLRRIHDNESRIPADQDVLTLPELLKELSTAVWTELSQRPAQPVTARKPLVSSLRRDLQREHLERLVDLTMPDAGNTAAYKPISNLALMELRSIKAQIAELLKQSAPKLDPYTLAHLTEAEERITQRLNAQVLYNTHNR